MAEPRPRIALVTDAIGPYHRGGKEQRYLELAPRLAGHAEVHVYTMNWWGGRSPRRADGVTYHAICPLVPLYRGQRRSILQAVLFAVCCLRLLFVDFDALEADHMPYLQLVPLRLVTALRRRRFVVTWHECWGPDYWRTYLGWAGIVGWWCESLALRLPDAIIAASPQTGDRLRDLVRPGVPVIDAPNGIHLAEIAAIPAAPPAVDVITVGRQLAHKRIDLLIDALALLRDRGITASACIVGRGPENGRLREHARRRDLQDQVQFRDDLATPQSLFAAVKASRVAVFPSEREGFGIAVLEALACGIPVIATTAPDNLARHLVARASGNGRLCAPRADAIADAIEAVLGDRTAARHAPPEWLREYDWDVVSARVAGALA